MYNVYAGEILQQARVVGLTLYTVHLKSLESAHKWLSLFGQSILLWRGQIHDRFYQERLERSNEEKALGFDQKKWRAID